MKRLLTAILLLAQTQLPAQPIAWQKAKAGIEAMLAGKAPLSYTEAIYLTENAWYDNRVDHELYTAVLQQHLNNIAQLAAANHHKTISDYHSSLTQGTAAAQYTAYPKALINWAIYTYMTDTALWLEGKTLYSHLPYSYSRQDPMGTVNWQHTQVMHLLASHTGNCYALASLYRIFSEQLGSEAALCTAPGHIYISHADDKGVKYNIELTGHSFPGTGSLQALSYSTTTAVKNGIALRQLNDTAAVALSLVYLAKGYEYKYSSKGTNYALQCAETALQYDPQNLNAMLLKAEVLEHRLQAAGKPIAALKHTQDYVSYEQLLGRLYTLGYREMPADMKNILVAAARRDYINTTPPADKERYAGISAGLFDEEHKTKATEQYGNTLLNTRSLQIEDFTPGTALYNNYDFDPVVFAWNMDPLTTKLPSWSPYAAMGCNPVYYIDDEGNYFTGNTQLLEQTIAKFQGVNTKEAEDFLKNIKRMSESDIEFYIQSSNNYHYDGEGGKTSFDFGKNRIILDAYNFVRFNPQYSLEERLAHELEHGRQFMDGELDFHTSKGNIGTASNSHDKGDEFKSFKVQQIITTDFTLKKSGYEDIADMVKANYQDLQGDVTSVFDVVGDPPIARQKYIETNVHAGTKYADTYNYQPTERQKEEKQKSWEFGKSNIR